MKERALHIPRLLVRYRVVLFALMTGLAVACALLIPHININSNMTKYLPDDYSMKQGLDVLGQELPVIQEKMQEFGAVFADGEDLMPANLPRTLAIGISLMFVVLLVMCSSVLEVLLFLITVGFAVAVNMGTNALLPSVSNMTNTLASVLQMVLSMDYSIILMNRYRQEKMRGKLPVQAMEGAIGESASSILSSAFTTMVSLLMLCFIKMKIGADLGIVLAKGVAISLICNFTVLPTLIIWGDKGIEATRKKVPLLPAAPLARFQHRFRYLLAALFVVVFVSFTLLQRRTRLSFSPQWDSTAADVEMEATAFMLLYQNQEESAIPALLDSLGTDSHVQQCLSYPSLVCRPLTVKQLASLADSLGGPGTPEIPEDLLRLVYYAQTHPQRTELFSFQELQSVADELSAKGMVPEGFNPQQIARRLMAAPKPAAKPAHPAILPVVPEDEPSAPVQEDTVQVSEEKPVHPEAVPEDPQETAPETISSAVPWLTYESATTPMTAEELAELTGSDVSQISMVYRLAGKRRGQMSLLEFITYVRKKILGNRLYAAMVSKDMKERVTLMEAALEEVLAAGPSVPADQPAEAVEPAAEETPVPETAGATETQPQEPLADVPAQEAARPESPAIMEPEPEPTPQERLLDMAVSGQRYPASQVQAVLSAAGIPVSQEEMDLMYLYAGAQRDYDPETAIAPGALLNYLADTLLTNPALARFAPDSTRALVLDAREQLLSGVEMLRGPNYSAAVILTDYESESDPAFDYVARVRAAADSTLQQPHYWIGESEMFQELKDGFPRELLVLTLLTVLSIFLIVALTFRSVLIPIPMVMTILAGVYANVWASGLGGHTLYYLSFLIIQGILMGATIDYSILFTSYYLNARKSADVKGALESAYQGSMHSILTSGLILALVPYVMSLVIDDHIIGSILSSLAVGSFAVLLLILFLLPGVIAALDPLLKKR